MNLVKLIHLLLLLKTDDRVFVRGDFFVHGLITFILFNKYKRV